MSQEVADGGRWDPPPLWTLQSLLSHGAARQPGKPAEELQEKKPTDPNRDALTPPTAAETPAHGCPRHHIAAGAVSGGCDSAAPPDLPAQVPSPRTPLLGLCAARSPFQHFYGVFACKGLGPFRVMDVYCPHVEMASGVHKGPNGSILTLNMCTPVTPPHR